MKFHLPAVSLCLPLLLTGALLLPACAPKKADKGAANEAVLSAIDDALQNRRQRMVAALPVEDTPHADGDEHPWLAWIKKISTTPPVADIEKAGLKSRGDTAEKVEVLSKWLQSQKQYYIEQKIEPNEYHAGLAGARRVSKGTPWEQDAEFDELFFHAAELARTWNLFAGDPHDDRVVRFFTYWKFVFGFNPKTSIYEDEVNVICATKLDGYCKDIPMEERPFQVMKPYYEGYLKQIADFKAKFPQSPYNAFLDRVAAQYQARIGQVPKWEEFPKFPEIRSTLAAPVRGNAVLEVNEKGVLFMDNVMRSAAKPEVKPGEKPAEKTAEKTAEKPAPLWVADYAPDPTLVEAVGKLAEDVRSTTASQYNQSNIMVLPEPKVPLRYLEPLLRSTIAGEHGKEWATMWLVGRRRADGTNRRAGFQITLLAKDKVVPFKVKSGAKLNQCTAWAVVGKDLYEAKGFQAVVFHDGKDVHAGRLGGADTLQGEQIMASGPNTAEQLDTWTDSQSSTLVVAVPEGVPYSTLLEALNGVALDCDKDECRTARNQPVFLATCR